jgi:hypothetical protein
MKIFDEGNIGLQARDIQSVVEEAGFKAEKLETKLIL